jgi:methionyl-tRNA formyltransferase
MRILFFGSGAFGVPTLAHLAHATNPQPTSPGRKPGEPESTNPRRKPGEPESTSPGRKPGEPRYQLAAIVSQPDRPAGRGSALTPTPVSAWALEHAPGTPLYRPDNINDPAWIQRLRAHDADAWVVIAYGQKLSEPLLADRFAINLHASLLPRWRGAAPINAAILAGDPVTGNSVITLARRMDAGLVLGRSTRPVDPSQTAGQLHDLLAADGPALVAQVLARHESGTLEPETQDESLVTIAPKLGRADAWLDLADTAEACRRRVHGLTPWPGVSVRIGDIETRLLRVEVGGDLSQSGGGGPGTLADADAGIVRCGRGTTLRLVEVQPAGKRPMPWSAFINGRRVEPGTMLTPTRERP